MKKIIGVLEDNNSNSSETVLLDKLDLLEIDYDTDAGIKINDYRIELTTVIAKLLSDNVSVCTDSAWLSMLSKGYTNYKKQNKHKKEGDASKSKEPLVQPAEIRFMSAEDFKNHKIGLYSQFIRELENLTTLYSIDCFDNTLTATNIFELQDDTEYNKRLTDEQVSQAILDSITLEYDSITKNNGYVILVLADSNKLADVKHMFIDLEDQYLDVKRIDYTISFMDVV